MIHQVLTKPVREHQNARNLRRRVASNPANVFRPTASNLAFCSGTSSLHSLFQLDLKKEIPMKSFIFLMFALIFAAVFCCKVQGQTDTNIVRPLMVDAKIVGAQIAKPGDYRVTAGDMLELEYSHPVIPAAMPKELSATSSEPNILSTDGAKTVVVPGLMGAGKKAFCFRAMKAGTSNVTIKIDGNEYHYSFTVDRAEGDTGTPELCKAVYTAIQIQKKVYVFANGVHPTAGYRTYFEKARIAIWPPQFSLMCEKPTGVAAQVLTPFSAQTSFNADDPIDSVTITDSDGKQTIKVVQVKQEFDSNRIVRIKTRRSGLSLSYNHVALKFGDDMQRGSM